LSKCGTPPQQAGATLPGRGLGTVNALQAGMKTPNPLQSGKVGYALLWLLGIPIPVLIGIFLLRGCN
jgi:hypothetical protein